MDFVTSALGSITDTLQRIATSDSSSESVSAAHVGTLCKQRSLAHFDEGRDTNPQCLHSLHKE